VRLSRRSGTHFRRIDRTGPTDRAYSEPRAPVQTEPRRKLKKRGGGGAASKLRLQLTALDAATKPSDLAAPGWRLHSLTGELRGFHSITVNGNWRVIFRFVGQDVELVDYLDYH